MTSPEAASDWSAREGCRAESLCSQSPSGNRLERGIEDQVQARACHGWCSGAPPCSWSERIRLRVWWQVCRRSGQPVAGDWSTPLAPEVVERSMCLLVCPEFTSLVRPVMGPHDSDTDSRDQRLFVRMVRMCLNWGEGQEYGQAKGLATGSF